MFRNQGPEYFGDTDEMDAGLAAEEEAAQRQGEVAQERSRAVDGALNCMHTRD